MGFIVWFIWYIARLVVSYLVFRWVIAFEAKHNVIEDPKYKYSEPSWIETKAGRKKIYFIAMFVPYLNLIASLLWAAVLYCTHLFEEGEDGASRMDKVWNTETGFFSGIAKWWNGR